MTIEFLHIQRAEANCLNFIVFLINKFTLAFISLSAAATPAAEDFKNIYFTNHESVVNKRLVSKLYQKITMFMQMLCINTQLSLNRFSTEDVEMQ